MMPASDTPSARLAARRENAIASNERLYHYTSLAGLQGIIDEDGFWASDNRFMNDAQEVKHGLELAGRVLDHAIRRAPTDFGLVLQEVRRRVLKPANGGLLVACFSFARDSLEQWRGYGASGGVCLRLGEPGETERPIFFAPKQMGLEVVYRARPQTIRLMSVIHRYARGVRARPGRHARLRLP